MPCAVGMRKCKAACQHREMVEDYRLTRHAQAVAGELEHKGHDTERGDVRRPITFKEWLINRAAPQTSRS